MSVLSRPARCHTTTPADADLTATLALQGEGSRRSAIWLGPHRVAESVGWHGGTWRAASLCCTRMQGAQTRTHRCLCAWHARPRPASDGG